MWCRGDVNRRWRRHARSASRRTRRRRDGVRFHVLCPYRTLPPGRQAGGRPRGAGGERARRSQRHHNEVCPTRRARLRPRGSEVLKHVRASPNIGISTAVLTGHVGPPPPVPAPVSHGPRRLRPSARVSPSAHVDTIPGGSSGATGAAAGRGGVAGRRAALRRRTPCRTLP